MKLAPGAGRNPGGAWGLLVAGAAAVALIGFGGVLWYAYARGPAADASVPLLTAEMTPIREKPVVQPVISKTSPELEVWDLLRKGATPSPVQETARVLPPPEAPLPRPAPELAAAPPAAAEKTGSEIGGLIDRIVREPVAAGPAAPPPGANPATPKPRPGSYRVQLASLASEDAARTAAAQARKSFGDLLGGLETAIVPAQLPDKTQRWRVQVGPLASKDAADALCGTLRARKSACLVVAP